jgi:translocation protein SEC72
MSHGHTHGPGEDHSHSHSQSPQAAQLPSPDPGLQALIDQDYIPSPLTLTEDRNRALCKTHQLEKCTVCDVDFVQLNRLSSLLVINSNLLCPPPANVITQKITQIVTATKDEGNVRHLCTSLITLR